MTPAKKHDLIGARSALATPAGQAFIYRLDRLEQTGVGNFARLPFSIKVLLEALLRNCDGTLVTEEDVTSLAQWNAKSPAAREVPFKPARVILQDFTGVPAVVDLAAMRSAMKRLGGDATKDQSPGSRRPGDRSLRASGFLRELLSPLSATRKSSSSATASATNSCAGASRPSRISAWCLRPRASCTR